ncbi:MAG: enoyl-CoA hydratase [Actinomyces sp.]|nr:MAG: enoyl-CoA hydratase [Actinomyces sp.]
MADFIRTETVGRVGVLTLHDPTKRNAVNLTMNAEIGEVLDAWEADEDIGALVVTGTPPAFCAGADLDDLLADQDPEGMRRIYDGFLRVAHTTLPTVAAVNGPAVGAGMNMVLACDLVLAGRDGARFDSRFLQIGLHPGGGHTWRLARTVGHQTTMAMVVFGQVLDAAEAERVGLAWRAVDDEALVDEAVALAARAAEAPKELVARTRATIESLATITDSEAAVTHELHPQLWSMSQPAFRDLVARLKARISRSG